MTLREANRLKALRPCLKCGKLILTDRCHRLCTKCGHANEKLLEPRVATPQETLHWLRSLGRMPLGLAN